MGLLNLGALKQSKVSSQKKNMEAKYENKSLDKGPSFGMKQGKSINLPKGNPPINK